MIDRPCLRAPSNLDFTRSNLEAMAPTHNLSGSFGPLLMSISPGIREIDFCNCSASNLV